jgi:GT2 family glycosyltransferase
MKSEKIEEKQVTIIIVTFNALNYVKNCLESIFKFVKPIHEIIIVDNASDDPTKEYLFSLRDRPNLKIIFNDQNFLWSPANNQGLKIASKKSEFCLLLNSDTEVLDPGFIGELQKPMFKYEKVGITGTQYNFNHIKPTYGGIDGCCFMFRKKLLGELGYLDENYPLNGAGFVYTVNAWAKGWFYYHVENDSLLVHYGKRSRHDKKVYLKNTRIDLFKEIRKAGLSPKIDYFSALANKLNMFNINRKLKDYYS